MDLPASTGRNNIQRAGLVLGPMVGGVLLAVGWGYPAGSDERMIPWMGAVMALMAIWWLTEAIPIYVTALLPLVLYPLLKIPPGNQIARQYGHPLIFLFLGGFLIAIAIENSGLHRRVALMIISAIGDNPRRLVLGFMVACGALSMWLSNTATTIMLLPIAASVISQAESGNKDRVRRFGIALMLGLAYGASIGGITTFIGTPTNALFKAFYDEKLPGQPEISLLRWMMLTVPYAITFMVIAWLVLTRLLYRIDAEPFLGGSGVTRRQLRELGPMQPVEWRMLVIFLITALLWTLREPVAGVGWAPWLGVGREVLADGTARKWVDDGTVAVLMAVVCFILPSGRGDGTTLLDWRDSKRVAWGILLLFGGGLALATGMGETGLDRYLGTRLAQSFEGLSQYGMMLLTAGGMTFFTELTSNLASLTMLLPVLKEACNTLDIDPRQLMITATLAASCAFMLPVATPPNAIVFSSGRLRMSDMIKAGVLLNLIGIVLAVAFVALLG